MRLFGKDGQQKLAACNAVVVGIGGLGTHVVQQLALLGVGRLTLIDSEELDETNRNRYVGARYDDPIPGTPKVSIGERIVREINPEIHIVTIFDSLVSKPAFDALIQADYVFGCLDSEGARLILTELCAAYSRPYFDLASDIILGDPPRYGGRICVAANGEGCLVCYGELDIKEAQADLAGPQGRRERAAVYGIEAQALDRTGPSVVSINGVVASLAVSEFMDAVTGIRPAKRLLRYLGHQGKVVIRTQDPEPDCYYCNGIRGKGRAADVERYLRENVGAFLR